MAAMNDFPRKKSRSSLRETGWLERSKEASSTQQSAKTGKINRKGGSRYRMAERRLPTF
jgi:hypothetical protein